MSNQQPLKAILALINPQGWGFRWGGGVVSNTTFTAIAAFIATIFVGWIFSSQPHMATLLSAGILGIAALVIIGNWIFSALFPVQAALGGIEYLRFRETEMGMKDQPKIIDAHNVEPPMRLEKDGGTK
jgi:hypothetical protein